jgi:hypothetical protein
MIIVYCENHKIHTHTLYGQNAEFYYFIATAEVESWENDNPTEVRN